MVSNKRLIVVYARQYRAVLSGFLDRKKSTGTGSRADRNARSWRKREESELPERCQ